MRKAIIPILCLLCIGQICAQEYFPNNSGVKEENNNYTAFTNATLYVTPTQVIKNGTLLIQNGKVVASGKSVRVPANAIVVDANGKYIYPSFIDAYTGFGVAKPKRATRQGRASQYEASRKGFYWNDHIMPENKAVEKFKYDSKQAEKMRKAGFGVVNTHIMDGIARGTGVLVALNDMGTDSDRILEDRSGQFFSFTKSVAKRQSYPGSLMGSMALLRQMNYDAQWYEKGNATNKDRSLEALIENKDLPAFFEAGSKDNDLRADKISDMFGLNYIVVGGGDEYESIQAIKNANMKMVLPINFPDAYDVSDPYQASYVSLADMRNWNQAPMNPKSLSDAGVEFALTTFKLKSPGDFQGKLMKAFEYGWDKTKALQALTTVPAAMLEKSDHIGTLQNGRHANFLITSGDIFDKETTIYENWVQGKKHVINTMDQKDIRGTYALDMDGKKYDLTIKGKASKPSAEITSSGMDLSAKLSYTGNWVNLTVTDKGTKDVYRATGIVPAKGNSLGGRLILPNGNESSFSANRTGNVEADDKDKKEQTKPEIVAITYPNIGYGSAALPSAQNVLFKNATVWTGEDAGVLEGTDVLVRNGKIVEIGTGLRAGGAQVIDATGKHLTAGVIDEHSHIAALSINEGGHNSSAEVSIQDVVDPEDVNIYRNLAGGVTTIQILHGSANPIGGQSAIIKLKWGQDADGLLYDDAPKFIKFALGENVKQSRSPDNRRFPRTRMGVEQVFVNYFNRAKEYDTKKKNGQPVRYDEEMEVLAEILNGERFISCHSYVQSEINMLMKVAEKFDFRVNTFTHILEGYKVADKMKEHGVGGSTFSDWWAYKYEVNDAIPYNAAIMAEVGVTVAINSDSGEMSRRLNQEAAKSVKYGGMSEEEAWKMVTLNPAKLLHIDDKVGSIKVGKDADLVLWTDHPLSVYARAEKTMIEGAIYFDMETDKSKRASIKEERNRLVKMMMAEKNGGGKTQGPSRKPSRNFHCESTESGL